MIIIKLIIDNIIPNMADFFFSDFKPFIPKTIPSMVEIRSRGTANIIVRKTIGISASGILEDGILKSRRNITTEIMLIIPHINDIDAFLSAPSLVC